MKKMYKLSAKATKAISNIGATLHHHAPVSSNASSLRALQLPFTGNCCIFAMIDTTKQANKHVQN